MKKQTDSKLDRREFIKVTTGAAVAISASPLILNSCSGDGMPKRKLGRTGEMISVIAVGGLHMSQKDNPDGSQSQVPIEEGKAIVRGAIDQGVNFLDNAWAYNHGKSEEHMGEALKDGYREKVMIMSKVIARDVDEAEKQLEDSLRRLQVEYLDVMQLHNNQSMEHVDGMYKSGGLIDWAVKKRDEGLIRYIGFTGHYKPEVNIEAIKRGFEWDTAQFPINAADFNHPKLSFIRDVLPLCLENNIGVIAMKTNGYGNSWDPSLSTPVECLRYAMSHPVSTMASGMTSVDIMNENVQAVRNLKPMDAEEAQAFEKRFSNLPEDIEIYRRNFAPRKS